MAARKAKPAKRRARRKTSAAPSDRTPPLPRGPREGIPDEGPLPHGEEPARPEDTGRHGA